MRAQYVRKIAMPPLGKQIKVRLAQQRFKTIRVLGFDPRIAIGDAETIRRITSNHAMPKTRAVDQRQPAEPCAAIA
jgi:hypothetical protein